MPALLLLALAAVFVLKRQHDQERAELADVARQQAAARANLEASRAQLYAAMPHGPAPVPGGAPAGPSTRTKIETTVGTVAGYAGGTYLCGPQCGAAAGALGGAAAPYVSRGAEWAGRKVAGVFS